MDLQLARSSRIRTRLSVATITSLGGMAVMAGALLAWLSARGPRPATGMMHTSLARMLAYSYTATRSFWTSAAFAVIAAGFLVVIDSPGCGRSPSSPRC